MLFKPTKKVTQQEKIVIILDPSTGEEISRQEFGTLEEARNEIQRIFVEADNDETLRVQNGVDCMIIQELQNNG